MKQKVSDWLLRLTRIDSYGYSSSTHICLYDMSTAQVMKIAEDCGKEFTVVRVFKLAATF